MMKESLVGLPYVDLLCAHRMADNQTNHNREQDDTYSHRYLLSLW